MICQRQYLKCCIKGQAGIYPSDVLGLLGFVESLGGGRHVYPEG